MRNSEGQTKTLWLGHSPFIFTVHRDKESSYIDIAMGNDNYLPIWLLWDRTSLRFEIWGRTTWGIPVSNTQEAELFSGFTGESARGLLNPCTSRNGKLLEAAPHRRDERDTHMCSGPLGPSFPSCSDIKPKGFRESDFFFYFKALTSTYTLLERRKRPGILWLLSSRHCREVAGFCLRQ